MKKTAILFTLLISALTFNAQTNVNLKWENDMNVCIQQSMSTKKPIMLFFTGSDWCGWCMRLQKEVFQTPEFSAWASENVILMEVDFPRKTVLPENIRQQNNQLQGSFAVRGYPTVFFVNPALGEDGKIALNSLGQTGYQQGGPTSWITSVSAFLKK
jgi:thioredoxin-related protein